MNVFYFLCTPILPLYRIIRDYRYASIAKKDFRKLASILYFKSHRKEIDWDHPHNLDEKINWMKFNIDTSLWSKLTDKFLVRDYVRSKGLEDTLNEIYGIYDSVDKINFAKLPESFVLKLTNGAGGVHVKIVSSRNQLDEEKTKKLLNRWLKYPVGLFSAEPHYLKITPQILVEKLLIPSNNSQNCSLVDYKFSCCNGEVFSILICSDRKGANARKNMYDLEWNAHPEWVREHCRGNKFFMKPKSFNKMVEYSQILSSGIPFVRVDWYEIDGKPIFGEMTFTPAGGYSSSLTSEYLELIGKKVKI